MPYLALMSMNASKEPVLLQLLATTSTVDSLVHVQLVGLSMLTALVVLTSTNVPLVVHTIATLTQPVPT